MFVWFVLLFSGEKYVAADNSGARAQQRKLQKKKYLLYAHRASGLEDVLYGSKHSLRFRVASAHSSCSQRIWFLSCFALLYKSLPPLPRPPSTGWRLSAFASLCYPALAEEGRVAGRWRLPAHLRHISSADGLRDTLRHPPRFCLLAARAASLTRRNAAALLFCSRLASGQRAAPLQHICHDVGATLSPQCATRTCDRLTKAHGSGQTSWRIRHHRVDGISA